MEETRICKVCGKEFKSSRRWRCPGCNTKIRRVRNKLAAIEYLGGKCNRCGWDKHTAGFEFHHTNPEEKEFSIDKVANKSWNVIKKELDKCELLCSNCHRIEHSDREDENLLKEVLKYNGNMLG